MSKHEGDAFTIGESTYDRVMRDRQEMYDAIPEAGEYRFSDVWSGVHLTYHDGKMTRREAIGGRSLDLYSYNPDSGELSVEKHCQLFGKNMAPEFQAVLHSATEQGRAEVAIKTMGHFLDLDVSIVKPSSQPLESRPALKIEASYRGSEPRGGHDSNLDDGKEAGAWARMRMWTNPYWRLDKISFEGCEHDPETGQLTAEFEFENENHSICWGRGRNGGRKEFIRDTEGRVEQTKEYSYNQGCLWRIDTVTYDPSSGDALESEITLIERGDMSSLWDDQPYKWVRRFDKTGPDGQLKWSERLPLSEEDWAVFAAPELPRLSEHTDILPAIDYAALKQELDAMVEESLRSATRTS